MIQLRSDAVDKMAGRYFYKMHLANLHMSTKTNFKGKLRKNWEAKLGGKQKSGGAMAYVGPPFRIATDSRIYEDQLPPKGLSDYPVAPMN